MSLAKHFDFTKQGGMPLTQEILAYMQESAGDTADAFVKYIGINDCIVCGLEVGNQTLVRSDGFIITGNKLLAVQGGIGDYIVIDNTDTSLAYANGTNPVVKYNRRAHVTNQGLPISNFVRLNQERILSSEGASLSYHLSCLQLSAGLQISGHIFSAKSTWDSDGTFDIPLGDFLKYLKGNTTIFGFAMVEYWSADANMGYKHQYCTAYVAGNNLRIKLSQLPLGFEMAGTARANIYLSGIF